MHTVLQQPRHMSPQVDAPPSSASVSDLLVRASTYPCSAATPAFARLAHSTSTFQLALDALLPVLESSLTTQLTDRILVSFILFSLYSPHPIAINPFKSVLFLTFVKEREAALTVAKDGGVSPNEPLVWVLWKILKGDGDDIGPYSPNALARSLLPPNLRATQLILDDALYHTVDDMYSPPSEAPASASEPTRIIPSEEDEQNAALAHAMRLILAARTRVLTLAEQRQIAPLLPALAAAPLLTTPDIAPLVANNPSLATPLLRARLAAPTPAALAGPCLGALASLPPTLPAFDVVGRLLRDDSPSSVSGEGGGLTIGALMRSEVLGQFVHGAVTWVEHTELEVVSDDRVAQAVQHLCRFYASLIKAGIVDTTNDADCVEMTHFSLRFARFGEARGLYGVLAQGRL